MQFLNDYRIIIIISSSSGSSKELTELQVIFD